jgi:hypothetical protein
VRPYVAFLTLHFKNGTTHKCSGTLVSPTLILTAAHRIVCTDSVTAQVYGDVSFFDNPLPGAAPTKKHESVSVAFNPAAYPTLPNCVGGDAAVFAEINKTTLWGADVAVVTLAEPVASVVPARMLLFPTRGFSPAQELENQALALVGRGFLTQREASTDAGDLDTMREGWTLFHGFRNAMLSAQTDNVPFAIMTSVTDQPEASGLLGGDSGGPMLPALGSPNLGNR